jgi:hypothetical protein
MSAGPNDATLDRRAFVRTSALAGAGALAGGGAIEALVPSFAAAAKGKHRGGVTKGDLAILGAAQIAEALAVTTYTNIIDNAPFFKRLEEDDQGYLRAARQEEMAHYLLEKGVTRKPTPFSTCYYPPKMFGDAQTTLNILTTLEDAFTPFLDKQAAGKAGFDTSKGYKFKPFTPKLPEPLGDFHSFVG